ncbi:MAG: acyl carrier protein [Blastopirellula sp.]|nr:MAG: acyl carrier protein [Blastopirellula sp.]
MSAQQIFDYLTSSILDVVPELNEHEFRKNDSLVNLGVGSMERADIIIMVLEKLRLKIPLAETYGPNNLGELADLLQSKSQIS